MFYLNADAVENAESAPSVGEISRIMPVSKPTIIVFDVNETLLDIDTLSPLFEKIFGSPHAMREWFAQLILYSEALTITGIYVPFGTIGAGVLQMLGAIHGRPIADSDFDELRDRMLAMPAHPDVPHGLARLRAAGFKLVTLTNSTPGPKGSPIDRAGIGDLFDRHFSVDTVQRYKPAPETYRLVADSMECDPASMCLVAAHIWDTLGAQRIGCASAFVARGGNAVLDIEGVPRPDIVAPDLTGVVDEILRRWS